MGTGASADTEDRQMAPQTGYTATNMKNVVPLFAFGAALVCAADAPSLTGKWHVHNSISGNESDQICTFAQKDAGISGSCTSERGTVEITGKVDGNKITWSYKSEYEGTPLTVNYEGTIDAAKISGSVNVPEFSAAGDFTATAEK
jgi:hypothetical protein